MGDIFSDLLPSQQGESPSNTTPVNQITSALATEFGYNDPEDNGNGAWGDNTNNPNVHGVSLPIHVLRSQFGNEDLAHGQLVKVTNPANGKTFVAPIIDKGPADWVEARQGNTIDLTHATNQEIGGTGKTPVNYEFVPKNDIFADLAPSGSFEQKQQPENGDIFADLVPKQQSQEHLPLPPEPPPFPDENGNRGNDIFADLATDNTQENPDDSDGVSDKDVINGNTTGNQSVNPSQSSTPLTPQSNQPLPPTEPPSTASKVIGGIVSPFGYIGQEGWNAIAGIQRTLGYNEEAKESAKIADKSVETWANTFGGTAPEKGSAGETAGQIAGAIVSFPALVGTGIVGAGAMIAQGYGGLKEDLYNKYKEQGLSDKQANEKSSSHAAITTVATLPAYILGGKIAGKIADKVIADTASKLVDATARFGFTAVANSVSSSIIRGMQAAMEGEDVPRAMKDVTLGGVVQDLMFAGHSTAEHFKEQARQGKAADAIKDQSDAMLGVLSKNKKYSDIANKEIERRKNKVEPTVAPSKNPSVNAKMEAINKGADEQYRPPQGAEQVASKPEVKSEATTNGGGEKTKEQQIEDLLDQQFDYEEGSPEWNEIQTKIDALNKGEKKPTEKPEIKIHPIKLMDVKERRDLEEKIQNNIDTLENWDGNKAWNQKKLDELKKLHIELRQKIENAEGIDKIRLQVELRDEVEDELRRLADPNLVNPEQKPIIITGEEETPPKSESSAQEENKPSVSGAGEKSVAEPTDKPSEEKPKPEPTEKELANKAFQDKIDAENKAKKSSEPKPKVNPYKELENRYYSEANDAIHPEDLVDQVAKVARKERNKNLKDAVARYREAQEIGAVDEDEHQRLLDALAREGDNFDRPKEEPITKTKIKKTSNFGGKYGDAIISYLQENKIKRRNYYRQEVKRSEGSLNEAQYESTPILPDKHADTIYGKHGAGQTPDDALKGLHEDGMGLHLETPDDLWNYIKSASDTAISEEEGQKKLDAQEKIIEARRKELERLKKENPEAYEVEMLDDLKKKDQMRYSTKDSSDILKDIEETKKSIADLEKKISDLQKQKFVPQEEKVKASRGRDALLKRIAAEEAFGRFTHEEAGAMRDFINQLHDDFLSDVALSLRKSGSKGEQGFYDFAKNIVTLVKDNIEKSTDGFDSTFLHEIWHSLSRFISPEDLEKVSKQYLKEQTEYVKKNPWFKALIGRDKLSEDQYNDWRKFVDQKTADKYTKLIVDKDGKPVLDRNGKKQYSVNFTNENYRFKNIDEWFAETMTDKSMSHLYDMDEPVKNVLGYAKKVYLSVLKAIKNAFSPDIADQIYKKITSGDSLSKERRSPLGDNGSENEMVRFSNKADEEKYKPKESTPQESLAKEIYDTYVKQLGRPPTEEKMGNILSRKFAGITSKEISELYKTASGEKPPQKYSGLIQEEENPEKISIRTKDQEDQVRRGILTSVVPAGEGMSQEEINQQGRANLEKGVDPIDALEKAKKGDLDSLITARAYFEALAKQKSEILKKFGVNSPEYKTISDKVQSYYEGLREAGTTASVALSAFKGETNLSDAADIATKLRSITGEEPTLGQHEKINKIATKVDTSIKESEKATQDHKTAMDEGLSDVEVKTPESIDEAQQQVADLSDASGRKNKAEIDRLTNELEETKKALEKAKQRTSSDPESLKKEYQAKIDDLKKQLDESKTPDPLVQRVIDKLAKGYETQVDKALERIRQRRKEGRFMSGLDPTDLADHAIVGAYHIAKGAREFGRWSAEMTKTLGEKIAPHLKKIWDESWKQIDKDLAKEKAPKKAIVKEKTKVESKMSPEEKRVNNLKKRISQYEQKIKDINEGKVSTPKDVEKVTNEEIQNLEKELAQKKQEISEARLKAKQKSLIENKVIGNDLNPEQVKTLWESAKKFYIDKGESDFDKMVSDLANDFGLTPEQVRKAFASPKGTKKATDEMYKKQRNRQLALDEAKRWLDNQKTSFVGRVFGASAEKTFKLAIFGHGTAFIGTHAPITLFTHTNLAFKAWLKGFGYSFKGKDGRVKNIVDNKDLINRPNWVTARKAGLENDPRETEREGATHSTGDSPLARALDTISGGRGFDALFHLRQDMFDQAWNQLSITQRTPEMAKIYADLVNHATGYTKGGKNTSGILQSPIVKILLFAPKLIASRFKWLIQDPAKMLATFAKLPFGKVSEAEKMGAIYEAKNKAKFLGVLAGTLLANQALLYVTGSNQSVNLTNPKKNDWLAYKGFGYQLNTVGAYTRIGRLFAQVFNALFRESRFQKAKGGKEAAVKDALYQYIRSGFSPITRDIIVGATGKDYIGNTVPWSSEAPDRGRRQLTWREFLQEQFAPIPLSEAGTQKETIPAIAKGITAAFTGTRLDTPQDIEEYQHSYESKGKTGKKSFGGSSPRSNNPFGGF